jgi:hypothetical protein
MIGIVMRDPAYPAARAVAPKVEAHFVRHREAAKRSGLVVGEEIPDAEAIEAIIDAAFWASLRREEGYVPKISLALVPPAADGLALVFEESLPLTSSTLVRVAPAVERPGIHLGVWREAGELRVWGATRAASAFAFILEVAAPGLLVVKRHRGDPGKFVNVAVIEGDEVKMVDERASSLPDCPPSTAAGSAPAQSTSWCSSRSRCARTAAAAPCSWSLGSATRGVNRS